MPDQKNNLYLYEAIELRSEYDARISSISPLLPENRGFERGGFLRETADRERPVKGLDIEAVRTELESLRTKRRKLNAAIQKANFENTVKVEGSSLSIAEVLELRKEVNSELAGLAKAFADSAYSKIIYKEERDIVEKPRQEFGEVKQKLEQKRVLFRQLNRALRKANYEITVAFKDE